MRQLHTRQAGRRGFTFVELLVTLGLYVVVVFFLSNLYRSALSVAKDSYAAAESIPRVDGALAVLKCDVWGATRIRVPDSHTLVLTEAAGRPIIWTFGPEKSFRRSAPPGPVRTWEQLASDVTVADHGPTVTITVPGDHLRPSTAVCLISQMACANGEQR